MTLPERVVIGPYTYIVQTVYKERNWGHVDMTQQRITIDQDLTIERQRVCLWHELTHACNDIVGVTDADTEERMVTSTSPIQVQMLRDNPALVAFLTAQDAA